MKNTAAVLIFALIILAGSAAFASRLWSTSGPRPTVSLVYKDPYSTANVFRSYSTSGNMFELRRDPENDHYMMMRVRNNSGLDFNIFAVGTGVTDTLGTTRFLLNQLPSTPSTFTLSESMVFTPESMNVKGSYVLEGSSLVATVKFSSAGTLTKDGIDSPAKITFAFWPRSKYTASCDDMIDRNYVPDFSATTPPWIDAWAQVDVPFGAAMPLTLATGKAHSAQENPVLSVIVSQQPLNAASLANLDGVTYAPTAGFAGKDVFSYAVRDTAGLDSDLATVNLRVYGRPAVTDIDLDRIVREGTTATIYFKALLGVDTNVRPNITVTTGTPAHGSITSNQYTPAVGYTGPDSFTFTLADALGWSETAAANIIVYPWAVPDTVIYSNTTGGAQTFSIMDNDQDADGDASDLEIIEVSDPGHGAVTFTADNVTYTKDDGVTATEDHFSYKIKDTTSNKTSVGNVTVKFQ